MNRNNPFRIAIWTMLSGFGLTVAMTVPNIDSARALLLAGRVAGDKNGTTQIAGKSGFIDSSTKSFNSIDPETTVISDSLPVLLGPILPNDTTSHEGPVRDLTARNISIEKTVSEEVGLNGAPESGFDMARFESHLMELLEKVDRLEHFQMQRQMSVPDPSAYLFFQNQISRQLEILEDRLQAFSTHQPVEHPVPITPDTFRPILRITQSTHDPSSPERTQDENSSDTVPLPRIIPKGTPW